MKKAAFLLALVMLLGLLPGCSQAEGEASVQSVSMICGLGSVGLADRFAGIVSPLGETKIKKDDSLSVDTIKVKVGDAVKVGDVLFVYDLSELQRNLEQAQLELEQQQNKLGEREGGSGKAARSDLRRQCPPGVYPPDPGGQRGHPDLQEQYLLQEEGDREGAEQPEERRR